MLGFRRPVSWWVVVLGALGSLIIGQTLPIMRLLIKLDYSRRQYIQS